MYSSVQHYLNSLDSKEIPAGRLVLLDKLVAYLRSKTARQEGIQLVFICTHNSRRSHLGQVWAQVAAAHFNLPKVATFSGGTEATACNPRTIAALERAGLYVTQVTESANPVYEIHYAEEHAPLIAFSKIFDQDPNPKQDFAAIMTCSHAEENCPYIPGAEKRFALTYTDPKEADHSPIEAEVYDARCRQIATEMLYVFGALT